MPIVRIFFSSPGDVGEERNLGQQLIKRLQAEFAGRITIEPIFWEHEPLRATASFQDQIPHPSEMDIVIFILWSRLGTRLPAQFTRPDGTRYASGTEYEFEDAINAHKEKGTPDILVYRKSAEPVAILDKTIMDRLAQKEALDAFIQHWFQASDGSFTAAFHNFSGPSAFEELLDNHLRKLLQARVKDLGSNDENQSAPAWTGSPFRGLEDFDSEHSPIFFGRTQAISDVLNALRKQAAQDRAFVLVMGMSGVGKSSLAKAGVLPNLTRPGVIENIGLWRSAIVRPSDTPEDIVKGLAVGLLQKSALPELAGDGTSIDELTQMLRETPKAAIPLIRAKLQQAAEEVQRNEKLANKPVARFAILLDQIEEIFTLPQVAAADRQAWTAAVAALARSGLVWVIATLRSDFYSRCTELPELLELKEGAGQYDLRPPNAAEVSQMIRQPARMAGLRFDTGGETEERLDDVLRDAAMHSPEALPLLEFTLAELYERRDSRGVLTLDSYRQIGGLEGALGKRAESVFASLDSATQAALPAVTGSLVAVGLGAADSVARKRTPLEKVTETPEAARLVQAFVAARLFVTEKDEDGTAVVQVAHEALLRHWPRVQEWLKHNQEGLSARARISAATALWKAEKQSAGFLLPSGEAVEEARQVLRERRNELDPDEIRYIDLSLAAADTKSKRRHESRVALIAAAVLAVLAVAIYLDGFVLERIGYYASFANRNGIPQGIGKISSSVAAHRQFSFRFTRKGRFGRLLKVDAVDGYGHLTTNHNVGEYIESQDQESNRRECTWRFEYDGDHPAEETGFDKTGRQVFRFIFDRKSDASNIFFAKYSLNSQGVASSRAPSGATYVKFTRSPEGYDLQTEYLALDGRTPVPNSNGLFREKITVDSAGRALKIFHLGPNGKPFRTKFGVAAEERVYDSKGDQIRGCYFDESGRPAWNTDGSSCYEIKRDAYGNALEQTLTGPDHRPVNAKDGYAIEKSKFNEHGQLVATSVFGFDGRPILHNDGYQSVLYSYDGVGQLSELRYLGINGRLTAVAGVAIIRYAYDQRGNTRSESYFGIDNRPAVGKDGYAQLLRTFNDRDQIVSTLLADTDGWPVRANDGYARVDFAYDDDGNIVSESYFDFDGTPAIVSGYWKLVQQYDDHGNKTETSYFQPGGRAGATNSPCLSLRYRHDLMGREIERTCLDQSGNPRPDGTGVTTGRTTYDWAGRITESIRLAEDGKTLVSTPGDYARVTYKYDDRGLEVERAFYDAAGRPAVPKSEGVARLSRRYDQRGNDIWVGYFGPDQKPVDVAVCNCAEVRRTFDDRAHKTSESFLDSRGQPVMHPTGGYARAEWKYDPSGTTLEEAYFDPKGPLVVPKGLSYARYAARVDAAGRILEAAFFGPDGNMMRQPAGYSQIRDSYDRRGNITEMSYRDGLGALVLNSELGFARIVGQFDGDNRIESSTYGADGKLVLVPECRCSTVRRRYDSGGRIVYEGVFGLGNEPVLVPAGYFAMRFILDVRGNQLEASYFGTDDHPIAPPAIGFAKAIAKYSPEGRPTEETFYSPDGKVTNYLETGIARSTWSYDAQGRLAEEDFYGPDGKAPIILGYSRVVLAYDASGLLLRKTFFDDRGTEVPAAVAITSLTPGGQAIGLGIMPGDILESYDGKPIRYSYWLQNLVKAEAPGPHEVVVARNGRKTTLQVKPGRLGVALREMTPGAAATLSAASAGSSTGSPPPHGK